MPEDIKDAPQQEEHVVAEVSAPAGDRRDGEGPTVTKWEEWVSCRNLVSPAG